MGRKNPVTLREMAKRAGVHVGTVSRALADDSTISDDRKKQIQLLAQQMNYRPRPFRRKRTGAIAILSVSRLFEAPEDLFQEYLIVALEQKAQQAGWYTHLHLLPRNETPQALPALIHERRVDGVVLSGHPSRTLCDQLAQADIPLAAVNDTCERTGLPSVLCDPSGPTETILRRLIELGHRRIAFAITDLGFTTIQMRWEVYQRVLKEHGLEPIVWRRKDAHQSETACGQQAVSELLDLPQPPTAALFTNDWMAMGAMIEMGNRALRVPDDLSLVGCDNVWSAATLTPGVTSIDMDTVGQVEVALRMIQDQLDDRLEEKQHYVQARLEWRDTAGPA